MQEMPEEKAMTPNKEPLPPREEAERVAALFVETFLKESKENKVSPSFEAMRLIGLRMFQVGDTNGYDRGRQEAFEEARAEGLELAIADCRRIMRNAEVMGYLPAYIQALRDAIVCLEPMAMRIRKGEYHNPTTPVAGEGET